MAVDAGAKALVDESSFPAAKEGTALVGPTVLVDVNHCKLHPSRRWPSCTCS
jgi:hypothetical protein